MQHLRALKIRGRRRAERSTPRGRKRAPAEHQGQAIERHYSLATASQPQAGAASCHSSIAAAGSSGGAHFMSTGNQGNSALPGGAPTTHILPCDRRVQV